jgi:hypothetical protein
MRTDRRLMKAYRNARVETFDDTSRFIIFSDCHRGDNSLSDEFSRNQNIYLFAMNYYYYNGYTYIEAGDGDELSEHIRFRHIRLAHSDIFMTLKKFFDEDRMILLYGNHNMFLKNPDYVRKHYEQYYDEYTEQMSDLFPGLIAEEALLLKHRVSGQEILTIHGHQGDLMNDQLWYITMFMVRFFWRACICWDSAIPPACAERAETAQNRKKLQQIHRGSSADADLRTYTSPEISEV